MYFSTLVSHVNFEQRKEKIKRFLLENPNSQFKGIFDFLKQEGYGYSNNKGLAKMLKLMDPLEIKKNDKAKPYPTYNVVINHSFASGVMGNLFRNDIFPIDRNTWEEGIEECYNQEITNSSINDNFETKFVKYMVMRYGFFLLSVFVKGHEQTISNKKFVKKEWIKQALDLFSDEDLYSDIFLRLLFDKRNIDESLIINDKKLKNKIKQIKKSMNELYPEQFMEIEVYEKSIEGKFNLAKDIGKIITKQNKSKR